MTVSTTTLRNSFSGNGSTTAFSYTFKIFLNTEMRVLVRTNSTGAESLKSEGTGSDNYSITGVGEVAGGTVTFVTAPPTGTTVVLMRESALQQLTDYQPADPFPAESHESALDKLTHIVQEFQEELGRSFKVSRTNTITTSEFTDDATLRAGKVLGFDASGDLEASPGRVVTMSATTLGAGAAATVVFNSATGAVALGIPVGATGATGATGSVSGILTTRGDLIIQGDAGGSVRLAVGAANRVLISDGTDPAYGQVPLATAVTGTLPVGNGGTGAASLAAANIVATNATSNLTVGYSTDIEDMGSSGTGTETVDLQLEGLKSLTINGNFTLAPDATRSGIACILTENDGAGFSMTTSGFDHVIGSFDSADDKKHLMTAYSFGATDILRIEGLS